MTLNFGYWLAQCSGLFTFFRGEKRSVEKIYLSGYYSEAAKTGYKMAGHREKAPPVCSYFFYIGHTGTPTKAKLNTRADKSNAN